MIRALYLRPANLGMTGLDAAVQAWLATQDMDPVDAGDDLQLLVCLPYCGGGGYYHRDVSIEMARAIVEHLAKGGELRWIHFRDTEVGWAGEADRENDYRVLKSVDLEFDSDCYGGRPTLAIMPPADVAEAERKLSAENELSYHDLGVVWEPPPPPPPREPGQTIGLGHPITVTETDLLRRIAAEAPDGVKKDPTRQSKVMDWMEGIGMVETIELDGAPAWRLTERGRRAAA
ncbi:hypothetical protein [Methylorubrum populi]|uniref:hypothetical protein n=1 Tax=Methylorubrum populi TaxID=223967 RepID=UPI00164488FE|nr:hypothetical protein [Methylorubrum populi]